MERIRYGDDPPDELRASLHPCPLAARIEAGGGAQHSGDFGVPLAAWAASNAVAWKVRSVFATGTFAAGTAAFLDAAAVLVVGLFILLSITMTREVRSTQVKESVGISERAFRTQHCRANRSIAALQERKQTLPPQIRQHGFRKGSPFLGRLAKRGKPATRWAFALNPDEQLKQPRPIASAWCRNPLRA